MHFSLPTSICIRKWNHIKISGNFPHLKSVNLETCFGVFKFSQKNERKLVVLRYHSRYLSRFFSSIFWKNWGYVPKNPFEIDWPLPMLGSFWEKDIRWLIWRLIWTYFRIYDFSKTEDFLWAKINLIWFCNLPLIQVHAWKFGNCLNLFGCRVFFLPGQRIPTSKVSKKRKKSKIYLLSHWLIMESEKIFVVSYYAMLLRPIHTMTFFKG